MLMREIEDPLMGQMAASPSPANRVPHTTLEHCALHNFEDCAAPNSKLRLVVGLKTVD
jgi:hypothetical protein